MIVTAIRGPGGTGAVVNAANTLQTTGSGDITVIADDLSLGTADAINSANDLTIRPYTAGTPLGVGTAAGGTLVLSDALLGNLAWGSGHTLTLGGATAGATTVATGFVFANPLAIVSGTGADITLAAPLTSSSSLTGPTLTLSAGGNFVNTAGAAALVPGGGVWRVYSTDPTADSRGGLVADFKQYDASYGVTPVLGSGDGFLHRIAPVLTPTLTGSVAKIYDGNTSASLASASVGVSGAIDGDSASFVLGGSASFDNRNAGSGKLVSAPVTITGVSNGAMPVYGYTVAGGSAAAPIGSISPAALVLAAGGDSKVYDGSTASTVTPGIVSGLVGGDSVSGLTQAFESRNAGSRSLLVTGYGVNDGNGGANYTVATTTAAGSITPAPLILSATTDSRVYDGSTASAAAPTATGLIAGDSVTGLRQVFDSRNAGSRSLLVTGYSVNDGNGGANYALTTVAAAGTIAPAPLTISADDKSRSTTQPNPPLTASYAGFVAGETAAVLDGTLSLATAAEASSPAGLYSIVPSGQSSQNYAIRYVNGTLTVLLAPAPPPSSSLDAALAPRDARLLDRTPATDGAAAGDCRPPAADPRLCVGWPVCQVADRCATRGPASRPADEKQRLRARRPARSGPRPACDGWRATCRCRWRRCWRPSLAPPAQAQAPAAPTFEVQRFSVEGNTLLDPVQIDAALDAAHRHRPLVRRPAGGGRGAAARLCPRRLRRRPDVSSRAAGGLGHGPDRGDRAAAAQGRDRRPGRARRGADPRGRCRRCARARRRTPTTWRARSPWPTTTLRGGSASTCAASRRGRSMRPSRWRRTGRGGSARCSTTPAPRRPARPASAPSSSMPTSPSGTTWRRCST